MGTIDLLCGLMSLVHKQNIEVRKGEFGEDLTHTLSLFWQKSPKKRKAENRFIFCRHVFYAQPDAKHSNLLVAHFDVEFLHLDPLNARKSS